MLRHEALKVKLSWPQKAAVTERCRGQEDGYGTRTGSKKESVGGERRRRDEGILSVGLNEWLWSTAREIQKEDTRKRKSLELDAIRIQHAKKNRKGLVCTGRRYMAHEFGGRA